jgi:putative ABC transport system ATP-binding protein
MALILRLVKEYKKTVLMVTHDPVVAQRANTTLHLEKGALIEAGASEVAMTGGAR